MLGSSLTKEILLPVPTYDYRCSHQHTTEHTFTMTDVPGRTICPECGLIAHRQFTPPAAIHFKGPGFYSTDVRGRVGRKRRPNAGDDLYKEFDTGAARIADSI